MSLASAARTLTRGATLLAAPLLVILQAGPAQGYAIEVHKDFWDLAFGNRPGASRTVEAPTDQDLVEFRGFVYRLVAARNPDFRRRWPSEAHFDAAAMKEFLGLNPGKQVVGIDVVPAGRGTDVRTIVREGSVDPDNDYRNQDRMFLRNGQVVLDPFGKAVPYDPRTLWFGGLTGTPSQFDAHGAMLRTGEKSDGVLTAFRRPEQFSRPPVVLGSAPEFSQMYTELAMMAHLWGGHGSEWLSLTFGGNNLHGLEDLGNQIHTTLVGIPEFFLDAKKAYYARRVRNMFRSRGPSLADRGFVAPAALTMDQVNAAMLLIKRGQDDQVDPQVRFALGHEPTDEPSDVDLAILIIGNHHRLLEDFVEKQYLAGQAAIRAGDPASALPEVRRLIDRARRGDADFERRCRLALVGAGLGQRPPGLTPFASCLAEVMLEHSAPEAAPSYRAIRKISRSGLKKGDRYDDLLGHQPLDFVTSRRNEHTDRIWDLSGRAFARVVTILRLWQETFDSQVAGVTPGSPEARDRAEAIADRLGARQMDYLVQAEQRRDEYLREKQAEWDELHAPRSQGLLSRIKNWFR